MSNVLQNIEAKLKRAEEHIDETGRAIEEFLGRPEERQCPVDSPIAVEEFIRAAERRAVDSRIAVLTGDAVHQMRSSLDHLIDGLIRKEGNIPTRWSQFPILADRPKTAREQKHYDSRIEGIARPDVRAIVDHWQPFQGRSGSACLRQLNTYSIQDKHRHLVLNVVVVRRRLKASAEGVQRMAVDISLDDPVIRQDPSMLFGPDQFTLTECREYLSCVVSFPEWSYNDIPVPVYDALCGMLQNVKNVVRELERFL